MRRTFNLLNQNCRLATRLVSESLDRPLDGVEATGLAIHLLGCRKCRRYRDQIRLLENLVKGETETNQTESKLTPAALERISRQLLSFDSDSLREIE
jgi:predicted anti-sigma-YlaC factor YlaD